jgi:hypothetical protein
MRNCIKSVLVLSCLVLFSQSSFSAVTCTPPKLTAAQCVKVRADFATYKAYVLAKFGNTPTVQKLIAIALADVNKLCPQTFDNHYSATTQFECSVPEPGGGFFTSLGVDSSLNLTNSLTPFKTACMSQSACLTIVPLKFPVAGASISTRCSDPADQTVLHLTDAEVQAKISALP